MRKASLEMGLGTNDRGEKKKNQPVNVSGKNIPREGQLVQGPYMGG